MISIIRGKREQLENVGISVLVATTKKEVPFPEDMICVFECSLHKPCSRRTMIARVRIVWVQKGCACITGGW